MKLYHYNLDGYYTGQSTAHLDQLETKLAGHDVFISVPNSMETAPPEPQKGKFIKWDGTAWEYEDIPVTPVPEPVKLSKAEQKSADLEALIQEKIRQQAIDALKAEGKL